MKKCSKCHCEKPLESFYKLKSYHDGHRPDCIECHKKKKLEHYYQHQDEHLARKKLQSINRTEAGKKRIRVNALKRYYKDIEKTRENRRQYENKKMKEDLNYLLKKRLRTRIWAALKGLRKCDCTSSLIGCSIEFFKEYITSKFVDGMSFSNYGEWHIDHIVPCASFDLSSEEQQKKCFHFSNLQPLWAKDNLAKHDKV